jgi:hypothetical protein
MPANRDLPHRKTLTFEQAEGIEPLPSQLARGQISQEFRAVLWRALSTEFERHQDYTAYGDHLLDAPWSIILADAHVFRYHRLDKFHRDYHDAVASVRTIIEKGSWSDVLGWLEFVLKHPRCPGQFATSVARLMAGCRLAYRVVDGCVICPISSETERETLERAFADLKVTEFGGARAHLRNAVTELTAGNYADSARESIHAVEATARVLQPRGSLSGALALLEKSADIHPALKQGFGKLYGYTRDEKGIRHPLLDDGTAKVDETDALFMIGACAAFVSYLINKGRSAGPLSTK